MQKNIPKALWIAIGIYTFYFFGICFLKFHSFAYGDYDLAIHEQIMWNILHGVIFNSLLGVDFLGNHMQPISFILTPLYALAPSPLTMLFFQSLALGLGALPVYLLARNMLGNKWALIAAITYLLYPAVGYINLFELHPPPFSTLFLLFMIYFFYQGKFYIFMLFAILAMFCQENIPLAIIMFGVFALIKRRSLKWVIWPVIIGGVYFWLTVGKLMPYFNKNTINFLVIYGHLGDSYSSIVMNILKDPLGIMKIMFVKDKLIYLAQLFGPLSFLSLLAPLQLFAALPLFAQHLLSLRASETNIHYHYSAELIPFIFLAFIFGIKKVMSLKVLKKKNNILMALILLVSIVFNLYLGPHFHFSNYAALLKTDPLDEVKKRLVRQIPAKAKAVATFEFLSHLTHLKELHSLHHVYMGFYTLSTRVYKLPDDVDYALLDFCDNVTFRDFYRLDKYKNLSMFMQKASWGVADVKDSIVLFQKGIQDKYLLYEVLADAPRPSKRSAVIVSDAVEFMGYDTKKEGDTLRLTFYWHSLAKTEKDINIFFDFLDKNDKLLSRMLRPVCYRIFPANAWQPGDFIREERYILLSELPDSYYSLRMGFFDYASGQLCLTNTSDNMGRVELDVNS